MDLNSKKIIRLPKVKKCTGLSRSSIYLKISKNEFPNQIQLGKRSVGWVEEEINSWINKQIQFSRQDHIG